MKLHYHKCTPADLDQLVEISRTTFIDAFRTQNNPEDFEHYLATAFHPNQLNSELRNSNTAFYFAIADDNLAGYFKLNAGDAQSETKDENGIELERIYVLAHFQGKQIGRQMLEKVKELARSQDNDYLWLGVWEENTRAIRFYEKLGFTRFGTHPYYIGSDKQTDWLMKLEMGKLDRN